MTGIAFIFIFNNYVHPVTLNEFSGETP